SLGQSFSSWSATNSATFSIPDPSNNRIICVQGTGNNGALSFLITYASCTTPGAPTGSATQTFCSGNNPKVSDLTATGSNIKWYEAATGATHLAGTTALVDGTHYFTSQTVSGCESSARFDVTATVNTTPGAPTGSASQTFCSGNNPKVSDLTATGSNIKWF